MNVSREGMKETQVRAKNPLAKLSSIRAAMVNQPLRCASMVTQSG